MSPPTVASLLGPPPGLPTLRPDHPLASVVADMQSWLQCALQMYEEREAARRATLAECVKSAHRRAVAATKRACADAAAARRERDDAVAALKAGNDVMEGVRGQGRQEADAARQELDRLRADLAAAEASAQRLRAQVWGARAYRLCMCVCVLHLCVCVELHGGGGGGARF